MMDNSLGMIQNGLNLRFENSIQSLEINIPGIISEKTKLLGRKKKDSLEIGKHTKYSPDNIQKKIKRKVIEVTKKFLNEKIIKIEIKNKNFPKNLKLKVLPQDIFVTNQDKKDNQELLKKNLKDIFYQNTSTKCSDLNNNKKCIKKLLELQNEKIDNILNMTFLQCLEHYGGIKYYLELEGMTTFEEEKKKNMEEEFIFHYEEQLKSFKEILDKKIEKKRKIEFDTMKTENSLRIDSINSESDLMLPNI